MQLVIFLLAWFIFTFGPGIAVTGRLTRDLDPLRRVVVALGVGSAAAPVLINLLGRLHLVPAFPFAAVALVGLGLWLSRGGTTNVLRDITTSRGDVIACAALVALAVGLGVIVFAHRLETTPDGIVLYGEYDTADLTYYAGEASEASHTIPPMAFYYSGHKLNAAYFPHLVPAMIHRFAAVPILSIYFQYAWPTFLALGAATGFVLVRSMASRGVATLAVALMIVASDFSYLAAWFLPQAQKSGAWDYVLWPTNFFSPTMQLLHFSTWGPSLPLFFTALFTIVLGLRTRARAWILVSALVLGVLFEFKPFAYVVLMTALCAAAVFSGRDRFARWYFVATAGIGVVFTLPFLFAAATLNPDDRRTRLVVEFLPLVKRMLIKLGLTETFPNWVGSIVPWTALQTPVLSASGYRDLLRDRRRRPVGGDAGRVARPPAARCRRQGGCRPRSFRLESSRLERHHKYRDNTHDRDPIPAIDTLQFYVFSLFLLWIFTAVALVGFARRHRRIGAVVVAAAVAIALPSSTHYLERRWTDRQRPPRVDLSAAEIRIADYLRNKTDPETTVILHDRPLSPSLTTILAERRIVLGWDVTYSAVGGQERLRDVNRFYSSADGNPDAAFESLGRYHVTHVIVRDDDRVHPAVLARLHMLMQFPGATLYAVP